MNKLLTTDKILYLASSSPRRQELIRLLGLPVEIRATDVDETVEPGLPPAQIVESLALRKAEAAWTALQESDASGIVIGSDTIVVHRGSVLGKPRDETDALRMLAALQGDTHEVFTGIACLDVQSPSRLVSHRTTRVTMKPLDESRIRRYIATGEPMDKAGSYGVQGVGATLVDRIDGDYFNVVGLSLALLTNMLATFGVEPF